MDILKNESETLLFSANSFENRLSILVSRRIHHLSTIHQHWSTAMASGLSNSQRASNRLLWISNQLCQMAAREGDDPSPLFWRAALAPLLAATELNLIGISEGESTADAQKFARNSVMNLADTANAIKISAMAASSIATAVPSVVSNTPLDMPVRFMNRLMTPRSYARVIWGDSLFDAFIPAYKSTWRRAAVESLNSSFESAKSHHVSFDDYDLRGVPSPIPGIRDTPIDVSMKPAPSSSFPFSFTGLTSEQVTATSSLLGGISSAFAPANSLSQTDSKGMEILPGIIGNIASSLNTFLAGKDHEWRSFDPAQHFQQKRQHQEQHQERRDIVDENFTPYLSTAEGAQFQSYHLDTSHNDKQFADLAFDELKLLVEGHIPVTWVSSSTANPFVNLNTPVSTVSSGTSTDELKWVEYKPDGLSPPGEFLKAFTEGGLPKGEVYTEARVEIEWDDFIKKLHDNPAAEKIEEMKVNTTQ